MIDIKYFYERVTCFTARISSQVRQGRLWPAVATERVAVLGGDVRGERGRRRQVTTILPLHSLYPASHPRQEGVAEQLAQQSFRGEVVEELGEVLDERERKH